MIEYTKKLAEVGLENGRMLSCSKRLYRDSFPTNLVAFNGVMCVFENDEVEQIWSGDLDINKDGDLIKQVANECSKTIYILKESEFFYSNEISKDKVLEKAIWNTDLETPDLTREDIAEIRKEDIASENGYRRVLSSI